MTGYTVNTGSTTKFSQGWDRVFGAASPRQAAKPAKASQAKTTKKAAATKTKATAKKTASKTTAAKTVRSKQAAQAALTSGKR